MSASSGPIMLTLIGANVLNVVVNWMLINGRLGAAGDGHGRRLGNGAVESGMAASLLVVIVVRERQSAPSVHVSWRLDLQRIR